MQDPFHNTHPSTGLTWVHQLARHAFMKPEAPALRYKGATATWVELETRTRKFAGTTGLPKGSTLTYANLVIQMLTTTLASSLTNDDDIRLITAPLFHIAGVGAPHPRWVETPVAFVVPNDPGDPPPAGDIIEFCQTRLASYKKPTRVHVVPELPRNAYGKILKGRLRSQAKEESAV